MRTSASNNSEVTTVRNEGVPMAAVPSIATPTNETETETVPETIEAPKTEEASLDGENEVRGSETDNTEEIDSSEGDEFATIGEEDVPLLESVNVKDGGNIATKLQSYQGSASDSEKEMIDAHETMLIRCFGW